MAKKKRRVPTPSWEQPSSGGVTGRLGGRSPTFYMTGAVIALVVIALGVVAYGFISEYVEDQRRPGSTAVRVGDKEFDLRYYTERLRTYVQQNGGAQSQAAQPQIALGAVTEQLVEETILLRFAEEMAISASESEVNQQIATTLATTPDAADFDTRLQAELDRTGISEDQFREQMEAAVLRRKIIDHFVGELPETAESVHFRQILVSSREEAEGIQSEIEGGADGAAIAMERSLDTSTSEEGGDAGWVPKGVLTTAIEDTLFSMEAGEVRVQEVGGAFYVFELLEKDDSREIETDQQQPLAQRELSEWIQEKRASLTVEDLVSTDNDKASWAIERAYNL